MTGYTIGIDLLQAGDLARGNKVAPAAKLRPCGDSSVWLSPSFLGMVSFGRSSLPLSACCRRCREKGGLLVGCVTDKLDGISGNNPVQHMNDSLRIV